MIMKTPEADRSTKPYILHVSGDFPDPIEPEKTKVIRSHLDLTKEHIDHRTLSINRKTTGAIATASRLAGMGSLQIEAHDFDYGQCLSYHSPGKGFCHKKSLEMLGDWIAEKLQKDAHLPDLIVGHKLTIEGIAVARAARILDIPYGLSIQSNTDLKIATWRPDLRGSFRKILGGSRIVFPFTPNAMEGIEKLLGEHHGPVQLLPCPTDLDQPVPPVLNGGSLVSVFHLKNHRVKNLRGLVEAYRLLDQEGHPPGLQIIGGGTTEVTRTCNSIVSKFSQIKLAGPMDRMEVRREMNGAVAFVMPSFRESFGLVFVEALFAGTPIIYPRGTAIDGYFDDYGFAISVDAKNPIEIAQAMTFAIKNEANLKRELAEWQNSNHAKMFTGPAIAATFTERLTEAAGF